MPSTAPTTDAAPESNAKRPRGRPRKPNAQAGESGLTRAAIIHKALLLTQSEPLTDISTVRLAREFGVVPGLIRYHVGGRDDLVSGVLNQYFKDLTVIVPQATGDWRSDATLFAHANMSNMLRYRGVAQYIASHNRYRLFQKVAVGEIDYGLEFFNQFAGLLMRGGLSRKAAAMGYHLLMQFLVASAMSEIGRMAPAKHEQYIMARFEGLDKKRYRGALYVAKEFAQLDAKKTFDSGLKMLIDGIALLK